MPSNKKLTKRSYSVKPAKPEKKHYHNVITSLAIGDVASTNNPPVFVVCNKMEQGTASNQRIGNRVTLSGFIAKFNLQASTSESATRVRLMLVSSKRGNITATSMPASFLGIPDYDRYWVHYDKYHIMNDVNNTKGPLTIKVNFKSKRNRSNQMVVFDSSTSADAIQNPLYLYAVCDVTNTNAPILNVDYNTYFWDT